MSSATVSVTHSIDRELGATRSGMTATSSRERISTIDTLRGFGLLGILVMNIDGFAFPMWRHSLPFATFAQAHPELNVIALYLQWILFEGKMRGIFCMLFGAGVILMTERAERRGMGEEVADVYLRRNLWLALFGALHYVLLWEGDILLNYALAALLFLYPLRRISPRWQLISGGLITVVLTTVCLLPGLKLYNHLHLAHEASVLNVQQRAGHVLSDEQKKDLQEWQKLVDSYRSTPENLKKQVTSATGGYVHDVSERLENLQSGLSQRFVLMSDNLGAMLIGMGLLRIGFLTGELAMSVYVWIAVIGASISVPLSVIGVSQVLASRMDFMVADQWLLLPYEVVRVSGMLAMTAVVVMIIKAGRLRLVQRALAAIGQTALSNYVLTSLVCQWVFVYGPWKLYGKLEFYQLFGVVLGVWTLNVIFSRLWLRYFAFGPLEWLWRSLTHVKWQPLQLRAVTAAA